MKLLSRIEEITLSNLLPDHLAGMQLPGAKRYYAHATSGEIILHEYRCDNCAIFFTDIFAVANDIISFINEDSIFLLLSLHRTLYYTTMGAAEKFLHEHHYNVLSSNLRYTEIRIEPNKKYSFVLLFVPPSYLKKLGEQFPIVHDFLYAARTHEQASLTRVSQVATPDILRLTELVKLDPFIVHELVWVILAGVTGKARKKETKLSEKEIEKVYQVREFLQANISGHYPLAELARHANTSSYLIRHHFKQVYNLSPFDLLRYDRIIRAARLLTDSPHTKIETIARSAGFRSARSMARNFHVFYKMSAHEYRDRTKS